MIQYFNMSTKHVTTVVTLGSLNVGTPTLRCAQPARYGQDSGPLDEVRQVEDVRAAARKKFF